MTNTPSPFNPEDSYGKAIWNKSQKWTDWDEIKAHKQRAKLPTPRPITLDDLFPRMDRWAIGWSETLESLRQVAESKASYPPYNITRDGDTWEIEIAVAGFGKKDLSISVEGQSLKIKSIRVEDETDGRQVIHRGIAEREFELNFALGDHVVVRNARMADGLLVVELKLDLPEEKKPKVIDII
jgi:molecular chaperone IbpA